jgi:hypothetical protein
MPTTYTTVKKVYEHLNLYTSETNEAVGTGNGSQKIFNLANRKVVESTNYIYLNGVLKAEGPDYTIDLTEGIVTFLVAPGGGVVVTANYWWSDIASSVVTNFINRAEDEINRRIGRSFYPPATITEYYDGTALIDTNQFVYQPKTFTDEFYQYKDHQESIYQYKTMFISKYPITAVGYLAIINTDGTETEITAGNYFNMGDEGRVLIKLAAGQQFRKGQQNVKITYTYGYSSVPAVVEDLATKMALLHTIQARLMGSPVPMNIPAANITYLEKEVMDLFESIGRKLEMKVL